MLDTHEKVKNALSNGAEETPAEPEVMGIEATPTPHVPLIGDDYNNVQFGPVPPPAKQPRNYMPTFGRQQPRDGSSSDESSSDEDLPPKKPASKSKKLRCVLCCPHPCVHTLTLVIVQDCERFEQGGAQEEDASQA
jgi:hypothetical protein